MISVPGAPFHDPDADAALIESLQARLSPDVHVTVLDADINDPSVAEEISTFTMSLMKKGRHD